MPMVAVVADGFLGCFRVGRHRHSHSRLKLGNQWSQILDRSKLFCGKLAQHPNYFIKTKAGAKDEEGTEDSRPAIERISDSRETFALPNQFR
jgi:hypothetical protein